MAGTSALRYTRKMNARAKELLEEVMHLPAEDREAFAANLLERLDGPEDSRSDAELAEELDRRTEAALKPEWTGNAWDEARSDIEQSLRSSRQR